MHCGLFFSLVLVNNDSILLLFLFFFFAITNQFFRKNRIFSPKKINFSAVIDTSLDFEQYASCFENF